MYTNVGNVNQKGRLEIMIKLKLMILFIIFITVSGCSEFALIASGSSVALSHNTYVRAYNGADVLMIMHSDKSIKKHLYDKGKKHVQTLTRLRHN